jgi:hypothetical protein
MFVASSWLHSLSPYRRLIIARAAPASTADALNLLVLLQLFSGHAADACAVEVRLLGLDAAQAAQLFDRNPLASACQRTSQKKQPRRNSTHLLVALLLPLSDQHRVGVVVLEQPLVQLLADGFLLVVEVINVARTCEKAKPTTRQFSCTARMPARSCGQAGTMPSPSVVPSRGTRVFPGFILNPSLWFPSQSRPYVR